MRYADQTIPARKGTTMTDLTNPGEPNRFDPAAPLPTADTATVDASKTTATIEALLDGITECALDAAALGHDPEGAVQFAAAAEHLARALGVVADFGAR